MGFPIRFGIFDKRFIYFCIPIIGHLINTLATNFFEISLGNYNPLFRIFLMCFGESLVILVEIIINSQFTEKKKQAVGAVNIRESRLEYEIEEFCEEPAQKIGNSALILLVAPIAFLDTIGSTVTSVLTDWGERGEFRYSRIVSLLNIIMQFLTTLVFCIILLKLKTYYIHHIIGFIIIVIGLIASIFIHGYKNYMNGYIFLSSFINSFLMATSLILQRYLMLHKFVSPYKLTGLMGMVGIIVAFITCGILNLIPCNKMKNFGFCDAEKSKTNEKFRFKDLIYAFNDSSTWRLIVVLTINVLASALYNVGIILVNFHYSPIHVPVVQVILQLFLGLIDLKGSTSHWKVLFGFLISALGSLIFSEFIILGFCGLDKNCKDAIEERALLEKKALIEESTENDE